MLTSSFSYKKNDLQPKPLRGLAMTYYYEDDIKKLGIEWFYFWGTTYPFPSDKYVPMSRCGEDIEIPKDYSGFLLVFNEPSNSEPYGCGITPTEGVKRYKALTEKYPSAKYVVGNVSLWDVYYDEWLKTFLDSCDGCKRPDALAFHAYIESWIDIKTIKGWASLYRKTFPGYRFWITELADTKGRPEEFSELLSWLDGQSDWLDRYAVFTNRASGSEAWYPKGWNVQLVNPDGELTPLGSTLLPKIEYKYYFPIISK